MKKLAKKTTRRSTSRASRNAGTVYVFKVTLKHRKSIWRRIEVRRDQTLDDVHEVIYGAFDRYDEHLYKFLLPVAGPRGRDRRQFAERYLHPCCFEDSSFEADGHNAAETKLRDLGVNDGQTFDYIFDFGDLWEHLITFEGVRTAEAGVRYPRVTDTKGESPPQYPDPDGD